MPDRRRIPHEPARAHLREALSMLPFLEANAHSAEPYASQYRDAVNAVRQRLQNALEQVESEFSDADTRTYPVASLRRKYSHTVGLSCDGPARDRETDYAAEVLHCPVCVAGSPGNRSPVIALNTLFQQRADGWLICVKCDRALWPTREVVPPAYDGGDDG